MKNLIGILVVLSTLAFNSLSAQNNNIKIGFVHEDGNTSLQWSTQQEVNSSYFLIEGSDDNHTFSIIGKVKAAGYSINKRQYVFDELGENFRSLFYRVTLVAMDGERSCALVTTSIAGPQGTLVANR